MKPDWKDAPNWANFLVQEEDGYWYWHEYKPQYFLGKWVSGSRYQIHIKSELVHDFATEIIKRPKE